MPFMKWENTFELNIKEFDDHHRHLVGLMNSLHANLISGASDETLGVFVGKLTDYAIYHFSAEEHWMDEHRYPGYIEHRDEHITFVNKICEFQKDFEIGKAELSIEVLTFLMSWLIEHILLSDANFGNFARRLSSKAN